MYIYGHDNYHAKFQLILSSPFKLRNASSSRLKLSKRGSTDLHETFEVYNQLKLGVEEFQNFFAYYIEPCFA